MRALWLALMPFVFVFLWSTGFIGARYGLPYTDPWSFLAIRFVLVLAGLGVLAAFTATRWPTWQEFCHAMVVGVLVHALYLGGVFIALDRNVPVGLAAIIVSLQPILTAIAVGPLFGERLTAVQIGGLILGVSGVFLVLFGDRLTTGLLGSGGGDVAVATGDYAMISVGFVILALLSITSGTLYQKVFCAHIDLKAGAVAQYVAATAVTVLMAVVFEPLAIEWTGSFVFALAWLVVIMSFGATTLLMVMIRLGAASRTASYFYLVPPTTALIAFFMFGETLGAVAMIGMVVSGLGVALVVRGTDAAGREAV